MRGLEDFGFIVLSCWLLVSMSVLVLITGGVVFFLHEHLARRWAWCEHALRIIASDSSDAVVICDENLRFRFANPRLLALLGCDENGVAGALLPSLVPEAVKRDIAAHIKELDVRPVSSREWSLPGPGSDQRTCLVTIRRLSTGHYLAIGHEVALKPQGAMDAPRRMKGALGLHHRGNRAFDRFSGGRGRCASAGADVHAMSPKMARDTMAIDCGQPPTISQTDRDPWARARHFEMIKAPFFARHRGLLGVLGFMRDATQEDEARDALENSERRLGQLFDLAADAILIADGAGRIKRVNPAACEMFGRVKEDLVGIPLNQLDADEAAIGPLGRAWRAGGGLVRGYCRRGRGLFPIEARTSEHANAPGGRFMMVIRDVSEQQAREDALQASEALARSILNASPAYMAVLDAKGNVLATNAAWHQFAERAVGAVAPHHGIEIGTNFIEACSGSLLSGLTWAHRVEVGVHEVLTGVSEQFSVECPCRTQTDSLCFIMTCTPIAAPASGALLSFVDITTAKRTQALQEQLAMQFKALVRQQLEIQEKERHRLSMELHDHIGQAVSGLRFALESLRLEMEEKVALDFGHALGLLEAIGSGVRDVARSLRPPMLDELGLASALRWHVEHLLRPPGVHVDLIEKIGENRFAPQIETAAFRVVQEALCNAFRHSKAEGILVTARCDQKKLWVSVSDNGEGFVCPSFSDHGAEGASLGIVGMRERVASVGGKFSIQTRPGLGSVVWARFKR